MSVLLALKLSIIHEIIGFLNTEGGSLLIGVNDEGEVIGSEQEIIE